MREEETGKRRLHIVQCEPLSSKGHVAGHRASSNSQNRLVSG